MHRQLRLDTSVGGNQRYSFIETPLEMHASGIRNGQQQQEIPPSQPLTVPNPDTAPAQAAAEQEQPQRLPLLNEKAQYVRQEAVAPGNLGGPNPEEHPAISAPYADAVPQPVQQHDAVVPDYSYAVPPPNSPGPLPTKTYPETPAQVAQIHTMAIAPDTNPLQSPQVPYFPGPPTASGTSYTPLADDVAAYHQPGQVSHPNQHIRWLSCVVVNGSWRQFNIDEPAKRMGFEETLHRTVLERPVVHAALSYRTKKRSRNVRKSVRMQPELQEQPSYHRTWRLRRWHTVLCRDKRDDLDIAIFVRRGRDDNALTLVWTAASVETHYLLAFVFIHPLR
ncbi:hypothetical protein OAory_01068270 [Aspergillus oryzae]|uniref:Uncharacterized protein n=1 Tax=Aspergillus oryzae TaxID=5062 RepID=A0A1S9D877_ASPOZ|nr:hypothetical protein OAory_01068270 [Aspergillus oryzae]